MEQSALYALDKSVLELRAKHPSREALDRLLQDLSWVRIQNSSRRPTLCLSVNYKSGKVTIPSNAHEVLRTCEFRGLAAGRDYYLTDGASMLHLRPDKREAYARISPNFFSKSKIVIVGG